MARRGWSKGSLFMGNRFRVDRRKRLSHLWGRRFRLPTDFFSASLHPRDGPFQAGDEVQFRRRESEHFLVLAIECIAQLAVGGHAASDSVIQVDAGVGEAGIPE